MHKKRLREEQVHELSTCQATPPGAETDLNMPKQVLPDFSSAEPSGDKQKENTNTVRDSRCSNMTSC